MSDQLIPASQFEVHNLKTKNVRIHVIDRSYIKMSGFGIWDKVQKGYVCMNDTTEIPGFGSVPVPYTLKSSNTARKACESGIYSGYSIVRGK